IPRSPAPPMKIPSLVLRQLYTFGSLTALDDGVRFSLKNRLSDVTLTRIREVAIDGTRVPAERLSVEVDGQTLAAGQVSPQQPIPLPLRAVLHLTAHGLALEEGMHRIEIGFETEHFGTLSFKVKDALTEPDEHRVRIPRDPDDDYGDDAITTRRRFVEEVTGTTLHHTAHYSFDPHRLQGNIESFVGVAQIPLGVAGPLTVHGEHARGDFLIPLATTEGTLVASYNRGMKVLNLSGGVTCTVSDDCMQRAPVFIFESAREARDFKTWLDENLDPIREAAEGTTSVGKL